MRTEMIIKIDVCAVTVKQCMAQHSVQPNNLLAFFYHNSLIFLENKAHA